MYMPIGHMVLKTDMPCKHFHLPSQYLYMPGLDIKHVMYMHRAWFWKLICPANIFSCPANICTSPAILFSLTFNVHAHRAHGSENWYALQTFSPAQPIFVQALQYYSGLDIKHVMYMPIGHMVLKTDMPCKHFQLPSQYLYKPCKAYVYCWENEYMPWLKNHLPSWAKVCALGQDWHALIMRACLNVEAFYVRRQ